MVFAGVQPATAILVACVTTAPSSSARIVVGARSASVTDLRTRLRVFTIRPWMRRDTRFVTSTVRVRAQRLLGKAERIECGPWAASLRMS